MFVGKQIGILLGAGLLIVLGIAAMPAGGSWRGLHGVAILGGIGFTMSLFIGTLAFGDATHEAPGAGWACSRDRCSRPLVGYLRAAPGAAPIDAAHIGSVRSASNRAVREIAPRLGAPILPAMRRTSYEQMNCSIASALDVVGEPWTLLIVRDAFYGVRRFDDFQENLGIARNVLTARLKKLVEAGVFRKTRLPPAPAAPRVSPDRQGARRCSR